MLDVDYCVGSFKVCREKLRLQVQKLHLFHSVLINQNLGLKFICKSQECLLFAQIVHKDKKAVSLMALHNAYKAFVGITFCGKVVLRVSEGVI